MIDYAPCAESGCEAGQDEYKSRSITGTFQVPNYLDSDDGRPGSPYYYAEPDDGLPDRIGGDNLFTARFYCSIARSVAEDFEAPPKAIARLRCMAMACWAAARTPCAAPAPISISWRTVTR